MTFADIENADRRDRARRVRRRRRRRGPRERGRPHHRGREDDAREDGVHDPPHERRDLPADGGRAARRAAAAADGRRDNTEGQRTAFTVSVDARHGTTHRHLRRRPRHHRAHAVIDPATRPERPRPARPHLPAALPRGRRAQARRPHRGRGRPRPARRLHPAGVLAEIVNDDGTMARLPELEAFAAEHGLLLISIADLIRYRRHREKLVRRVSEARIPTQYGDFTALRVRVAARRRRAPGVRARRGGGQGERARARALRVPHRRRVRLDALRLRPAARPRDGARSPRRAPASSSTSAATRAAASASATSCAPTRCRTRAATPSRPTSSSGSRPTRASTASARRSSSTSASPTMRLMTNNPAKYGGIEGYGLEIVERVPLHVAAERARTSRYLRAKQDKLGHLLEHLECTELEPRRSGAVTAGAANVEGGAVSGEYATDVTYRGRARRDGDADRDRRGPVQRPHHRAAARRRRSARCATPASTRCRCTGCRARSSCRWSRNGSRRRARSTR